jgi:hypothetical protein
MDEVALSQIFLSFLKFPVPANHPVYDDLSYVEKYSCCHFSNEYQSYSLSQRNTVPFISHGIC